MRAKFINEIVRRKSSGISSLGIGKTYMNKGYNMMVKLYPGLEKYSWSITNFDKFTAYESYFGSEDEDKTFEVELSKREMKDISMISKIPLKELLYINPEMHNQGFNSDFTLGSLEKMTDYLGSNYISVELETKDVRRQLNTVDKIAKFMFVWWEDVHFGYLMMDQGTWVFLVFRDPNL